MPDQLLRHQTDAPPVNVLYFPFPETTPKTITAFFGTLPLLMSKGMASTPDEHSALEILQESSTIQLRPLNSEADNLFARHGSHSSHASHASHASHYSGAGSSNYVPPQVSPSQYEWQNNNTATSRPIITPTPNKALVQLNGILLCCHRYHKEFVPRELLIKNS